MLLLDEMQQRGPDELRRYEFAVRFIGLADLALGRGVATVGHAGISGDSLPVGFHA